MGKKARHSTEADALALLRLMEIYTENQAYMYLGSRHKPRPYPGFMQEESKSLKPGCRMKSTHIATIPFTACYIYNLYSPVSF